MSTTPAKPSVDSKRHRDVRKPRLGSPFCFAPKGLAPGMVAIAAIAVSESALGCFRPASLEQIEARAERVIVATVESSTASWTANGVFIVTTYDLRVEEVIKGNHTYPLQITMPGGRIGKEAVSFCTATFLDVGSRYLLFLSPTKAVGLSPFVSGSQGVFRDGDTPPTEDPLRNAHDFARLSSDDFRDLLARVRSMVTEDNPPAVNSLPGTKLTQDLPSKDLSRDARPNESSVVLPFTVQDEELPPRPLTSDRGHSLVPNTKPQGTASTSFPRSWNSRLIDPPLVFDPLDATSGDYFLHDQSMMSRWNLYSDLFRVHAIPSADASFGNDRSDIVGWLTNDQLAQYTDGERTSWGDALALTALRESPPYIIEADIIYNAHESWTLDVESSTSNGVPGFHFTTLHEIGHAAGLAHPFEFQTPWWDASMNAPPMSYRHPRVHADDALGVRRPLHYPDQAIRDGLISIHNTYYLDDPDLEPKDRTKYEESEFGTIEAGESLSFSEPITLENVGTEPLASPSVEVYLTKQRLSWDDAIHLGTQVYPFTLQTTQDSDMDPTYAVNFPTLQSVTVPRGVWPGSYYPAVLWRDTEDGAPFNNSSWSLDQLDVTNMCATEIRTGFRSEFSSWPPACQSMFFAFYSDGGFLEFRFAEGQGQAFFDGLTLREGRRGTGESLYRSGGRGTRSELLFQGYLPQGWYTAEVALDIDPSDWASGSVSASNCAGDSESFVQGFWPVDADFYARDALHFLDFAPSPGVTVRGTAGVEIRLWNGVAIPGGATFEARADPGLLCGQCAPGLWVDFPSEVFCDVGVWVNGAVLPRVGCPAIARLHWDWGDGTAHDSWFPATHTYQGEGSYDITVTAYDLAGNSTTETEVYSCIDREGP